MSLGYDERKIKEALQLVSNGDSLKVAASKMAMKMSKLRNQYRAFCTANKLSGIGHAVAFALRTGMISLLALMLACAHAPCRNCVYQQNVIARYQRKDCHDLPAGKFQCKSVVLDPQTVNLKGSK